MLCCYRDFIVTDAKDFESRRNVEETGIIFEHPTRRKAQRLGVEKFTFEGKELTV